MAKFFESLNDELTHFIERQHLFFVGTAGSEGRVNVSPKGMDSLRVINEQQIIWLNYTGSGNESAAHVLENERMTIMFCSFDKQPLILRIYGSARAIHPRDQSLWDQYQGLFEDESGARQFFELQIELVQTSCGFAVPVYDLQSERDTLKKWAVNKGIAGIEKHWATQNTESIDGKPTAINKV